MTAATMVATLIRAKSTVITAAVATALTFCRGATNNDALAEGDAKAVETAIALAACNVIRLWDQDKAPSVSTVVTSDVLELLANYWHEDTSPPIYIDSTAVQNSVFSRKRE